MGAGDALHERLDGGAMGCLFHRRAGRRLVADLGVEAQIARQMVPEFRGAGLDRLMRQRHRRQHLVIDMNERRRFLGGVLRFGDNNGDGLADMAGDINDQRVGGRHETLAAVAVDQRHVRADMRAAGLVRDGLDSIGRRVGAAPHGEHAGNGPRLRRVDAQHPGVGVGGTRHGDMGRAGKVEVVGVLASAPHKSRVFPTLHRIANARADHPFLPVSRTH